MSTAKKKQQVRPELKVRKINGVPQALKGISRKSEGMLGLFATANLPSAAGLPNGCLAIDTTLNKLVYVLNGTWTATA